MRALALLALLLALPLLATPGGAQQADPLCVITIRPNATFNRVEVIVDLDLDEAALDARARAADTDGDGRVSAAEVEAHAKATRRTLSFGELGNRTLSVDGDLVPGAFHERLVGFDTGGRRQAQEVRTFVFAIRDRWFHEVEGGSEAPYPRPVPETVVLEAPPGWLVWRANTTTYLQPTVTVRDLDVQRSYLVSFIQQGVDPANPPRPLFQMPEAPPALAVLAAAAAALALARRAR